MEIILTEKDLGNAVKLYLAFSGVTRKVSDLEFARKLKGTDAGISVSIEIDDEWMSDQDLADLAMSQKRANSIETRASDKPSKATKDPTPTLPSTEKLKVEPVEATVPSLDEDEESPFTTPAEDAALAKAEKAYPDPEFATEGNAVPESSPFADLEDSTSDETDDAAGIQFDPPADENPFGDDSPVVPAEADADEEAEEESPVPINLFG